MENGMENYLNFLPSSIWSHIFSHFNFEKKEERQIMANIRLVCKKFREFTSAFWFQIIRGSYLTHYSHFSLEFTSALKILQILKPIHISEELPLPKNFGEMFPNLVELSTFNHFYFLILIQSETLQFLPSSLRVLKLNKSNINDQGIAYLPQSLTFLNLSACINITEIGFQTLPSCLQYLNIGYTKITDEAISYLPKSLTSLNLNNCGEISNNALKILPPNLQYLHLAYTKISDEGIAYLPKFLTSLYLNNCVHITNEGLKFLPQKLRYLNLRFTKISNEGIPYLPKTLTSLNFDYCDKISNEGLQFLPSSLQVLELCNSQITDKGIQSLSHLTQLRKLYLHHQSKINLGLQYLNLKVKILVFIGFKVEIMNIFLASIYYGNIDSTKYFVQKFGSNILSKLSDSGQDVWYYANRSKNKEQMIQYLKSKRLK